MGTPGTRVNAPSGFILACKRGQPSYLLQTMWYKYSLSIKKATRYLTVKDVNIDGGHWCCPWLTVVGSRVLHISVTDHNPGADGVIQPGRQVAQGGLLTVRTVHVL